MNILVTGGASGLGRSITEKLAAVPVNKIFITYSSSADAANELKKKYNIKSYQCNFNVESEVDAFCTTIENLNIDVVVNNAFSGSITQQHFHKSGSDIFKAGFMNNIIPVVKINQACIAGFRKRKSGRIITILSSAIINRPPVGWSEYTASKAYLHSLAKSWAVENAPFNISSNCISPAFMLTALTAGADERMIEEMTAQHPLKNILTTAEVAEAVQFFVTASPQINGTNMIINSAKDLV